MSNPVSKPKSTMCPMITDMMIWLEEKYPDRYIKITQEFTRMPSMFPDDLPAKEIFFNLFIDNDICFETTLSYQNLYKKVIELTGGDNGSNQATRGS